MNILFVSATCSIEKYNYIYNIRKTKMLDPSQKFHDLLIQGIHKNGGIKLKCLTALPVSSSSAKKRFWKKTKESVDENLEYIYLGFINGKITRYLTLSISSFLFTLKWVIQNRRKKDKVVLCDPLVFMCSCPARMISKLFGVKNVAIVTDIPSYSTSMKQRKMSVSRKIGQTIFEALADKDICKYDSYILLVEAMNSIVNPQNKPYLVVEGSVNESMVQRTNTLQEKDKPKVIMYAGGVYEKFGVGNLIKAFQNIQIPNVCLYIYGDGSYVNEVKEIATKDKRIHYGGVLPVDDIVEKEIKATLLVNPRPSNEEFTKYSFPSKTLEYMVSGTPVLTTRLAGIPQEYDDYLYFFGDETVAGMSKSIEFILSKSIKELHEKGLKAKHFVITNKNNIIQGERIVEFIKRGFYNLESSG